MGGSWRDESRRCAVVGDGSLVMPCLSTATAHGLHLVVVASRNPDVLSYAGEHEIATVDLRAIDDLATALGEHRFDVLFSIAYQRVLPDSVLDQATTSINFHDGPLPSYAGLNVTSWAIFNGEQTHAITWHEMTSRVDAGDVLLASTFPIAPDDTAYSLNARCYDAAVTTFPEVAARVAARALATTPQPKADGRTYLRRERPLVPVDAARPAAWTARGARALDVGPRIDNLVGSVRLVLDDELVVVGRATVAPTSPGASPGTLTDVTPAALRIATVDGDLLLGDLRSPSGTSLDAAEVAERHGLVPGAGVPLDQRLVTQLGELDARLAATETWWIERLADVDVATPAILGAEPIDQWSCLDVDAPPGLGADDVLASVVMWLAGVNGADHAVIGCTDTAAREVVARLSPLAEPPIARLAVDADEPVDAFVRRVGVDIADAIHHGPFLRDLVGRSPALRGRSVRPVVSVDLDVDDPADVPDLGLLRVVHSVGAAQRVALRHRLPSDIAARVAGQLAAAFHALTTDRSATVRSLPLVGEHDRALLDALNATSLDHDRSVTVDELFRRRAKLTPDAPAVTAAGRTFSYRKLEEHVAHISAALADAGVTWRDTVGISLPRGVDMLASVLAVLERGAAYLPLDPAYPADRLQLMVGDACVRVIVADARSRPRFGDVTIVDPAGARSTTPIPIENRHGPDDLAYLIYTSGSTGVPKGVELEHRQVANFFVAMDAVIDHDPPGVWLAVTSLSFDISVLELLWTLTRGFHVVLKQDTGFRPSAAPVTTATSMSLFYFAAGEEQAGDGYRLLLDSAAWADANGFEAVWTPERHFHDFGAPYPNPSVVAAALAVRTSRVAIRAGSVVLPLHSPARVAEEWAVVDNLSGGRVGVSFASGWQPNDFVLKPDAYASARESLPEAIDIVHRLWRGETVELTGHDGTPVPVRTRPRPVQQELPTWLTSAGSTATYERAGRMGLNVLTHLLGQSVEQLADNIARYRDAWRDAGHGDEGRVTLMLHTFLDDDAQHARDTARLPLKEYLGTAAGLLKDIASAFPTFAGSGRDADEAFRSLSADELSQLLDMATDRYLSTSGLFGTVDDAVDMIERLSAIGVDEIACLIDFGIDTDRVLRSLDLLGAVHRRACVADLPHPAMHRRPVDGGPAESVADLVRTHGVTHLQCTPSLAAMLVANPPDRDALGSIRHVMLGGEALPVALATELRRLLPSRFTNMYGPTETTIWSLVHDIDDVPDGPVPIGRPIANTTVAVLDRYGRELPTGAFGELHIGGEGVARGYHDRRDLTSARFVERPGLGRAYATGDVARVRADGVVEFGGRADNQVKIRGHRIELGEIEAILDGHPAVAQSVVVARGGDEPFLVGFVTLRDDHVATPDALRQHVAATLPDAMVPTAIVVVDSFPVTPNGKVDRGRLPGDVGPVGDGPRTPLPSGGNEALVAGVWAAELGRPVGRDDNFFDVGGHSLMAVTVFRRLGELTDVKLELTDVFRYPTVRAFAAHLDGLAGPALSTTTSLSSAPRPSEPPAGASRGAMRRRVLAGRAPHDGSAR